MTDTIQNSEGVEVARILEMIRDGMRCDTCAAVFLASDGHPEPECAYPSWDAATSNERAEWVRHSLAREPATADVERAVAQLRRWEDETPIYAGNDPRADYYRQRRETIRLAIAALSRAALSRAAPSSERCPGCDGTGDMVLPDGEWMGICPCPVGDHLRAQSSEPAIAGGERAHFPFPVEGTHEYLAGRLRGEAFLLLDSVDGHRKRIDVRTMQKVEMPRDIAVLIGAMDRAAKLMREAADAILAQSSTPPASKGVEVPAGWKLVPVESTEEMFQMSSQLWRDAWQKQLSAILAASPTPSNDTLQGRGATE